MKSAPIITTILALSAGVYGIVWLLNTGTGVYEMDIRKTDPVPFRKSAKKVKGYFDGEFITYDGKPSTITGSWSQFRGGDSLNIAKNQNLAAAWAKAPKMPSITRRMVSV